MKDQQHSPSAGEGQGQGEVRLQADPRGTPTRFGPGQQHTGHKNPLPL